MNKFTKSYHARRRREQAKARKARAERAAQPFAVVVYDLDTMEALTIERYSTHEQAQHVCDIYNKDGTKLWAYIK